jgi:antitoxin (DNA-binding transcriptional repressor) of toxin-antitoxin stability system
MGASSIPISAFDESTRTRIEELRGRGDRITIEDNGVPVAALVSVRDAEALDRLEQKRERARATVDAIRSRFEDVSEEELMNEALKAQREVRADMDRERAAAIDAIHAADPNLSADETHELAQMAVRRAHERIRHEHAGRASLR